MKKITKYFLFALVYPVVIFLFLEAALRIIFPPTTLLPPSYNGNVETSEYNMLIKTNSIGLRADREYAANKPILQKEHTTFFTKNKINYLDMLPLLKASCTDCYYFKDNHWNAKGTEFAGSEIYNKFKELQFTNKV